MVLGQVLSSELGLSLVGAVLGTIWTAFRSTEWFAGARARRYAAALEALEAGVDLTYDTYVRAIKEARADGKLTKEEIREARRRACDAAISFGRSKGIDVLREVGAEYVDLWIAKLVKRLKRR